LELDQALAYLDAHTNREAMVGGAVAGQVDGLSLEPTRRLLATLGDPHLAYPAIHVTGTNGKGSVVGMITALLAAQGLTAGAYTSPHLEQLNERITRNGEPISDEDLARVIGDIAGVEELAEVTPSYFEILTVGALAYFAETGVDVGVVEVGLLGRWDATNVVEGEVAVITNVGRDHTDGRGDWRRFVASEKAGIIKPGSTVVLGETDPDLLPVFEAESAARMLLAGRDFELFDDELAVGGRYLSVETPWARHDGLFLSLHGRHQSSNAAIAITAVEAFFDRSLGDEAIAEAFSDIRLGGRFEVAGRSPLIVLDGAHNPDGARSVAETLDDFTYDRRVFVLGMLQGRDITEMLEAFRLGRDDIVIATECDSPRTFAANEIADAVRARGASAETEHDAVAAFERASSYANDEDLILVTGSLYVVGTVRTALRLADLL
jgi:dihydrofolate synthase/folylpolyglutamate synthase